MKNLVSFYYEKIREQYGKRKADFFFLRYLLFFPYFSKWIKFIHSEFSERFSDIYPIDVVRSKFTRFYYSKDVDIKRKYQILTNHYELCKYFFDENVYKKLLSGNEFLLATINGKSFKEYRIILSSHERFIHEGELTIRLVDDSGFDFISSLTFFFGGDINNPSIFIGGLQGLKSEDSKKRIVEVTKDFQGLRPKSIVLEALYGIADAMKVKYIEAVCCKMHPLQSKNRALYSDYDSFFEEIAVGKYKNGKYILPLELPQRDISEVASKKRKAWLAKSLLKAEITNKSRDNLSVHLNKWVLSIMIALSFVPNIQNIKIRHKANIHVNFNRHYRRFGNKDNGLQI